MFGYLPAPCRCQIGDQVDLYRSAFCGLCNALASQYGAPARMLINRDSTFVALLAAAQIKDSPSATASTRCQPWRRSMPVFEAGPAPAFAAAVTLCGLQAKLDDERVDERGLRAIACRFLSFLSRPRFDRAHTVLAASGFPVTEVERLLAGQSRVEAEVRLGGAPMAAAQPSAYAFGAILAHTARLAGNDANVAPLAQAGRSLGELIYTLDAYEDLNDDLRHGRFNFLAAQVGASLSSMQEQAQDRAREIAAKCRQDLRQAWGEVELLRYRSMLDAVLLTGLSTKAERALATGVGRSSVVGDEDELDEEKRDHAASGTCFCDRCDSRCCDCCDCYYCPGENDRRCCGECCGHGCYYNDVGCRGGDGNGCDCSGGGCSNCDYGSGDGSSCPCCGCDCNPGDGCDCSSCDCGNCDCGGCDCNCSN